ncbi:MAG: hypothetical protein WDM71_12010 [Ferruginibacter sp.]
MDEVREADILLHVVDVSHQQYEDQLNVVNKTLAELGAAEKATVTIFNKWISTKKIHLTNGWAMM